MTMMRWDPARELQDLWDRMNRLTDGGLALRGDREWSLALDVVEDDNNITVEASVPGVKAEDLDVSIEDGTLTIKGTTSSEHDENKEGWHIRERRTGSFFRSLRLPDKVDESKASVTLKDGVLRITAPLASGEGRKKLTVKSGS